MIKLIPVLLLASIGLLFSACSTQWVEVDNVNFTQVGKVEDKCHENEERVKTQIAPIAIVEGSFKIEIEACVQKDVVVTYLDSMEKLRDEVLGIDPLSKRIYADQVEKLVRTHMKAVGKDRNGEDVPRAYKVKLFEWKTV